MASSVNLGAKLDEYVDRLVKDGRYGSRSEVLREGVRLVQEREAKWALRRGNPEGDRRCRGGAYGAARRGIRSAGRSYCRNDRSQKGFECEASGMKVVLSEQALADLETIAR